MKEKLKINFGRKDYNEMFGGEENGMPGFLIIAQDQVAAQAVRGWAHLHRVNGGSDPAYFMALKMADLMEAWPHHKAADLPPVTANEFDSWVRRTFNKVLGAGPKP